MNLVEQKECVSQPNLFAGLESDFIPYSVVVPIGSGKLVRGTLLKEDGGTAKPLTALPTSGDVVYVLSENIDTTTEEGYVTAYASGLFNRAAIVITGGVELTSAGEEILRQKGIYLDVVIPKNGPVPTVD